MLSLVLCLLEVHPFVQKAQVAAVLITKHEVFARSLLLDFQFILSSFWNQA